MKYLYRIVNHSRGWYVAVERNGIRYTKFFGDVPNGSPNAAKAAAKKYLAELLEKVGSPNLRNRITKRNRWGLGVIDDGPSFRACWYDESNKRCSKSFNKATLGFDEALRQAQAEAIERRK